MSNLSKEWAHSSLRGMMLIREFEETADKLSLRGKIPGGIHNSSGQEAVPWGQDLWRSLQLVLVLPKPTHANLSPRKPSHANLNLYIGLSNLSFSFRGLEAIREAMHSVYYFSKVFFHFPLTFPSPSRP